jgi:cob(I)alamin adenosyltransferase
MKIYTRKGDDGSTSLAGGRRISKFHSRVEAYGSVDELISWIGLIRDHCPGKERKELLKYIQSELMSAAASLAGDPENKNIRIILPDSGSVERLEHEIDRMEEALIPLRNFILPGGAPLVSYCHIARTVCRRAERNVLRLCQSEKCDAIIPQLLNRLADFLFVLARKIALELDCEEDKWII